MRTYAISRAPVIAAHVHNRENQYEPCTLGEGYELFKSRADCIPHAADELKRKAQGGLRWLDGLIAGRDYIDGYRFSLADLPWFTVMDFMEDAGQPLDRNLRHVSARFDRINARASVQASIRPSAAALRWMGRTPGSGTLA